MLEKEIELGLLKVKEVYGLAHAKRLEQLFRNETSHFKSGNFLKTLSAGMEIAPTKTSYPFGWTSLKEFWDINPHYKPTETFSQVENTSTLLKSRGARTFIVFPSIEASMMTVSHLIKIRNNNFGAWFSKNAVQQLAYVKELDKIKVRFIS
jgi:hypothetical protein